MKKSEIKKQIAETKQKLARIRELKTLGVDVLIESEMEKFQLLSAARSIPDSLQKFAIQIGKIETDDLMPVIDEYRKMFGPEQSDQFQRETISAVRALMDTIQKTKDTINNNIDALESGQPINDMSMNKGMDDMGGDEELDDEALDDEMGDAPDDLGDEMGEPGEFDTPEEEPPEMEPGLGRNLKESAVIAAIIKKKMREADPETTKYLISNIGSDTPEYRAAKTKMAKATGYPVDGIEDVLSFEKRLKTNESAKKLRQSADPDALILETFKKAMKSAKNPSKAAKMVAEHFAIDIADVKEIVRESARRPFVEGQLDPDEQAAEKIWAKIQGTPNLTMGNLKPQVSRYLKMVGKAPSDLDYLTGKVAVLAGLA